MTDSTRRLLAYVILRLTSARSFSTLQDQTAAKAFLFEADLPATKTRISVLNRELRVTLKGAGGGGFYTLTDSETGKPLSLKMKEGQFEGFDYGSGKPYSGTLTGNSVLIYDTEVTKEFRYVASL